MTGSAPRRRHRQSRSGNRWWETVLGIVLLVVAAYSAGSTYAAGERAQTRAQCQARVNDSLVAALQVRDTANRSITEAQRQLVIARLDGAQGMTPRQADESYIAALDELQRTRDANPLGEVVGC